MTTGIKEEGEVKEELEKRLNERPPACSRRKKIILHLGTEFTTTGNRKCCETNANADK